MERVLDWGIEVVLWFQQASPQLDAVFAAFTFLGDEEFFLIALPLIYWSIDRAVGVRLMVVFLLSGLVNQVAKHLAVQPRPYQYDSRVVQIVGEDGFGIPSGHTQSAVVVWGVLGSVVRKKWFWVLAGVLMVLIPVSRVYLGVHFPTDVLGGYVLGALVLWLWLRYGVRLEQWFFEQETIHQLILIVAVPALAMAVWPTEDMVTGGGTMVGLGAGLVLERNQIRISMDGKGRWRDNVFVERLWRSVKYEEVYLRAYETVHEARSSLAKYFDFYNHERGHQSLNRQTPWQVYTARTFAQAA